MWCVRKEVYLCGGRFVIVCVFRCVFLRRGMSVMNRMSHPSKFQIMHDLVATRTHSPMQVDSS